VQSQSFLLSSFPIQFYLCLSNKDFSKFWLNNTNYLTTHISTFDLLTLQSIRDICLLGEFHIKSFMSEKRKQILKQYLPITRLRVDLTFYLKIFRVIYFFKVQPSVLHLKEALKDVDKRCITVYW
jgi:hypothetical protein